MKIHAHVHSLIQTREHKHARHTYKRYQHVRSQTDDATDVPTGTNGQTVRQTVSDVRSCGNLSVFAKYVCRYVETKPVKTIGMCALWCGVHASAFFTSHFSLSHLLRLMIADISGHQRNKSTLAQRTFY